MPGRCRRPSEAAAGCRLKHASRVALASSVWRRLARLSGSPNRHPHDTCRLTPHFTHGILQMIRRKRLRFLEHQPSSLSSV